VNYRSDEEATAEAVGVVEEIHGDADAMPVQADASDPATIADRFETVDEEYGRVDVYAHNAAVTAFKPLSTISRRRTIS